jgi:hypothetical protein
MGERQLKGRVGEAAGEGKGENGKHQEPA